MVMIGYYVLNEDIFYKMDKKRRYVKSVNY